MNTTAVTGEFATYLAEAQHTVADLPQETQETLLGDLAQMLLEVSAEIDGSLRELLGPPEQMMAELRATAGHGPPPDRGKLDVARTFAHAGAALVAWVGAEVPGLRSALRPFWWIVRGMGFVGALALATSYPPGRKIVGLPFPAVFGSPLLGALMLAIAVVGSVAIGRRAQAGAFRKTSALLNGLGAVAVWASLDQLAYGPWLEWSSVEPQIIYIEPSGAEPFPSRPLDLAP